MKKAPPQPEPPSAPMPGRGEPRASTPVGSSSAGETGHRPAGPPAAPGSPPASAHADGGHDDRKAMVRSAGMVSFMTIVSRVLGLFRDRLMAAAFGATWVNDAFQMAFLLPNMTRRLFGEGALSSAFVPVFSERLATGRKADAFRSASVLLSRLAVGLFIACTVLVLLSFGTRALLGVPSVAAYLAGRGWDSLEKVELTLRLAEIMLGYCILINVAAVLMGVLNSLGHFAAPAAAPVLLNLAMIGACLFGLDWLGAGLPAQITVVALAVMAGGILQLLIMIPPALRHGFAFRPCLDKRDAGYREVMTNFVPVIFGVALFQINLLLDQLIARVFIPEDGPVTMLAYGNRLVQLPWALFSLSFATAALPLLSRYWAEQRHAEFARGVSAAIRHTLYLAVPSAVGLCLLSRDLVRLFYGAGEFLQRNDGEAITRTGNVVFFFALGLVFYSLNAVLARAIYATKETRVPTRAAAISVGLNLVLNLVLVLGTGMRECGLALASALSGGVQTFLMARALYQRVPHAEAQRLKRFALRLAVGVILGAGGAAWAYRWIPATYKDMEGFVVFLIAGVVAVLPLWWLGRSFFLKELAPLQSAKDPEPQAHRYGVPDARWPNDLIFYHGLYTLILAAAVTGLMVWAVRDSLPPEGQSGALIVQRGLVPVAAGMLVFLTASGAFASREYEELKTAFMRVRKRASESRM